MVSHKHLILLVVFLLNFSAFEANASSSRSCTYKAKIVDIVKTEDRAKQVHPDVTFGGVCYAETYYVQIKEIEINDSVYLSNTDRDLPYCRGLIDALPNEGTRQTHRPIGIKLCMNMHQEPPKVNDIIDIRYNWSMGRTDSWATVSWTYLSLHMDRESRKKLMAIECEDGDGSICTQLGQMCWQDQDETGALESYRRACEIDQGYCTYYQNALNRTDQKKMPETK